MFGAKLSSTHARCELVLLAQSYAVIFCFLLLKLLLCHQEESKDAICQVLCLLAS